MKHGVDLVAGTEIPQQREYEPLLRGEEPNTGYGYHLVAIPKGVLGELSKVQEELSEALDAEVQGNKLMVLLELSDALGAVEAYLATHAPDFSISDLQRMADATKRAFISGHRKASD